ncbi:glycosyltransferase [Paenibacillus cremeus]|uniref:glycosyltransferase n=1 Tax=Paenibacillus cremeus TaxID=2163881 RepID=UPI0016441261
MKDERISFYVSKQNEGLGKTIQKDLILLDTPYFMTLDSDDWVEPETLELLLDEMEY